MTASVVRVGGTVHRSAGPRAGYVAELLTYLESIDFSYAPRYLGTDEHGRQVLTYIEGNTTNYSGQRTETAYAAGGRMLRALHDATAGHRLAGDAECVAHGDPGPFNVIFRHGSPVAFIDWDTAHPGDRIGDLAYMGWTWTIQSTGTEPITDQARRLHDLAAGYGPIDPRRLLDCIIQAQTGIADREAALLADPDQPPARRAHARAAVAWATADRQIVLTHYATFLDALQTDT